MVISLLVATWTERKLLESVHVRCSKINKGLRDITACRNCVLLMFQNGLCTRDGCHMKANCSITLYLHVVY